MDDKKPDYCLILRSASHDYFRTQGTGASICCHGIDQYMLMVLIYVPIIVHYVRI